jgi:TM2 domain-containing membrane protein YozV/type II secretory pathway pseudopilin PulG
MKGEMATTGQNMNERKMDVDEKLCESCREVIKTRAEICPKCGVRQRNAVSKAALMLITFFLGGIGGHKFYLGKNGQGALYLVFCWTLIPGLIALIEFIIYAFTSKEKLQERYSSVNVNVVAIVLTIGAAGILMIGILAAVAIPKFTIASYKAKASEIPTVLTAVYAAEQAYQAKKGEYSGVFSAIGVDIPNSQWFSYSIDNVTATTFTVRAVVKTSFGSAVVGSEATINQSGEKTKSQGLTYYLPTWQRVGD